MENRFEIQGNSLIIHLPKEVDHMETRYAEIQMILYGKNIYERSHLIFQEQRLWTVQG